jgi:NADH-quinone oxidoreductase subunit H
MNAMPAIVGILLLFFGVLILAAMTIWLERRLLGNFQERYGPNRVGPLGLLQVVADTVKVFTKENWVAPFSDRPVFIFAPTLVIITALASFAVIPLAPGFIVADVDIGLLFFLAMSSLAVYGVALSGWASNSKFSLIGAMRAVGQMVSYEVFMGISVLGVVVQAGSFSMGDIVKAQSGLWNCVPQAAGLCVFFVASLAETRRIPFDLPEADSELVAGYHTEYSGFKFAMFYLGEYVGVTLNAAIIVTLFFGGWLGPFLPAPIWFLLKTVIVVAVFILIRASLPRPRYDQLIAFGWKLMFPIALVNLLATGFVTLIIGR